MKYPLPTLPPSYDVACCKWQQSGTFDYRHVCMTLIKGSDHFIISSSSYIIIRVVAWDYAIICLEAAVHSAAVRRYYSTLLDDRSDGAEFSRYHVTLSGATIRYMSLVKIGNTRTISIANVLEDALHASASLHDCTHPRTYLGNIHSKKSIILEIFNRHLSPFVVSLLHSVVYIYYIFVVFFFFRGYSSNVVRVLLVIEVETAAVGHSDNLGVRR